MNPSTALARVLVDELLRGGVREVVLAPGSRSGPLAFAVHEADRAGRLRLHVRIDERSAGYLAVGLALREPGPPAAVICTSGTAATNLHPAVAEADAAGVPLVAITADRPPEMHGVGANQTIEQRGLFGGAVRHAVELGPAERRSDQNAYWRAATCRALEAARFGDGRPGPVHLNVAFRPPLVPGEPDGQDPTWPESLAGRPDGSAWTVGGPRYAGRVPGRLSLAPRTLLMVGTVTPQLARVARQTAKVLDLPLVVEPGRAWGCDRALSAGALLLDDAEFLRRYPPTQVVVVGRPTLGRALGRLVRRLGVALTVVDDAPVWTDPDHRAATVCGSDDLAPDRLDHRPDDAWNAAWRQADTAAAGARDRVLGAEWPTGPGLAREVVAALPADSLLFVGSSNPVRDVNLAAPPRPDVTMLANRGAAGIDGCVSTAVGAALQWQAAGGGGAYALVGDLTFLHDGNGLLIGPAEPRPDLTVVVANNDGGGLFGLLEEGAPEHGDVFERVFGTPHGADLASLCAATATPFARAHDVAELRRCLRPSAALRVVEVRVPRADDRVRRARLAEAVGEAVSGAER